MTGRLRVAVVGAGTAVAVCDGARSRVRDAMHALTKAVRPYPWGALWYIGRDPERAHAGQLLQVARGAYYGSRSKLQWPFKRPPWAGRRDTGEPRSEG